MCLTGGGQVWQGSDFSLHMSQNIFLHLNGLLVLFRGASVFHIISTLSYFLVGTLLCWGN